MAQTDTACHSTRHVAAAAGLPQKQLEKLLDRAVLVAGPNDIDPGGSGRPRRFTRRTAFRFAIAAALLQAGLPPAKAAALAERAARHKGRLVIAGDSISVGSDVVSPPAALVIDLDAIGERVHERLPEAA